MAGWLNRIRRSRGMWTPNLLVLATSVFIVRFGQGLVNGASTNFFIEDLGISGSQVMMLQGFREIPGLLLMFIAAVVMHLPLARRAVASVFLMGVGFGLYAVVGSYAALIAVVVLASIGFHNWIPLESSLAMGLVKREHAGRVMGALQSVGALASIVGIGAIAALALLLPLRAFFAIGGALIVVAAMLMLRLPTTIGDGDGQRPRMLIDRKYWLYYVLIFFDGLRTQFFAAFGVLVLVEYYGLHAREISILLVISSVVNLVGTPRLGHLLDRYGERTTLSVAYVVLAACFAGYGLIHNVYVLGALLVAINLLLSLAMGLSTYVRRIAPPAELTPTLTAGVSVNHISSVSVAMLAGVLLSVVGYEWLALGAAGLILLSVPFALALRTDHQRVLQQSSVPAE